MAPPWLAILLVLPVILADHVAAAAQGKPKDPPYFYISEGEDKCFVSNAPDSMPLTVSYNNRDNQGVACQIYYKDPSGRVVFSRHVTHTAPKGKMSYLTKVDGDYRVCISCPTSQWFASSKIKWSLSIDLGESEELDPEAAKKEHIDELESSLMMMLRRLDVHSAETMHQKSQEELFHTTSESISFRFLIFAIVKIFILLICTAFSVYHLTRFFQTQKLI